MVTRGFRSYQSGLLEQRVRLAQPLLQDCELCPRRCRVNRREVETGRCATAKNAVVASYSPHFGEEQPLVGRRGSGTIFFSGCSLGCCFCQNFDISRSPGNGREVSAESLAAIMLELQDRGCHNINFVTPSHVVPQILASLPPAYESGLKLPLVYNCSGYESSTTLRLLDGIVDIYMPDFKFWSSESASRYADAPDYPECARAAVTEMYHQVGDLRMDQDGIASQGLIIRHLLMPGALDETRRILEFIAANLSAATYVNIMDQYRPCGDVSGHPELQGSIKPGHFEKATAHARKIGLTRLDSRDLSSLLRRLGMLSD